MKSNIKMKNTHREINLYFLKIIYDEAFFWYLIHMDHTMKQSEIEVLTQMKN